MSLNSATRSKVRELLSIAGIIINVRSCNVYCVLFARTDDHVCKFLLHWGVYLHELNGVVESD